MSGTALAQAIGFAMTPIISRLFSPADFGVFGSFSAILGVVGAGITLDYTQALMLPKERAEAANVLVVAILVTILISGATLLFTLFCPQLIQETMGLDRWSLSPLLFLAALVSGLGQSIQAWCIRSKAFKRTSAAQVVRSLSSNGAQIGAGYLNTGPIGLITSTIIGASLSAASLSNVVIADLKRLQSNLRWDTMKRLAYEYRDFPMYSASQNVINALSSGLPVLLLTHFYGVAIAGAYTFGMRILQVPMGFVLTALRQVLFQKASETRNERGDLASLYGKVSIGLFILGLPPSIVITIWAPQIFSVLFGSQWLVAGEYARSLIIWLLFVFCNLPAVLFARLIRIQRAVFIYDCILLCARTTALVVGGLLLNASATVTWYALVGAFMNLALILFIGRKVKQAE